MIQQHFNWTTKFLLRTGIAVVSVALAIAAGRYYQSRRRVGTLTIRSPNLSDGFYYADLARMELPPTVEVVVEELPQSTMIDILYEGNENWGRLARIKLPDQRVYRTLPRAAVRIVYLDCSPPPTSEERSSMQRDVHESAFMSLMQVPRSVSSSHFCSYNVPRKVLCHSTPRVVAECFLHDVAEARHDPIPVYMRVADDVCEKGCEHHGGDWNALLNAIQTHFLVDVRDASTLDQLADILVAHRLTFSSAMLSASGANHLELVFGVSATHFPFLHCTVESVAFVEELYRAAVDGFGRWTYDNFVAFMHAVFGHDRPEIVRHVPRIFRTLNKSRTGEISFDELCAWIAKKLSTRNARHPEQHLLATVMSLRLPYALFIDKRSMWPKLDCVLRSLSDDEYHV